MQCGKWTWHQAKQWNLGPILSVLESQIVLTTSEQVFVDLGRLVALIIPQTGSWYSFSLFWPVLFKLMSYLWIDYLILVHSQQVLKIHTDVCKLIHTYSGYVIMLSIFTLKLHHKQSTRFFCLLPGYCHCKDEGRVSRKNWTTWMSGMYNICSYSLHKWVSDLL